VIEFELKFQVDPRYRKPLEAALERGRSQRTRLRARYFDTADGALAAAQVVLRLRREGSAWVQTAKAPSGDPLQRHEHNVEIRTERASEQPLPSALRHAGTPVGDRIDKALRKAGHDPERAELVPLYGTDIWRTTREMRSGDALVELAFDRGEVQAGERSHAVRELELELKRGSPRAMLELARRWQGRYALWLDTVSKSERGERLVQDLDFGEPMRATAPRFGDEPGADELFRAVLNACLTQILPNASEVAAGSPDAEHVHQLRVGIRRLRTALREMGAFAPALDASWEPVLADAFRALGRLRDRERLLQTVQPQVEAAGGPPVAWPEPPDGPTPEPGAVVRAAPFQNTLMSLIEAALPEDAPQDDAPAPDRAVHKPLRERLSKLHRQVVRDGRRFEALSASEQHRVRKRLKRLRYLSEFVAPLFGARKAQRYLDALRPAQDALGDHNDAAMAIDAYREAAAQDGRAWFAAGWLAARQPAGAQACHEALAKVGKARPFWTAAGDKD
jgi:inorganic triphosphatase YgiF